MQRRWKLLALAGAVVLVGAVVALILYAWATRNSNGIRGEVTSVVDRPNIAEDGYYGFTLRGDNGKSYAINATGFLDTPSGGEGSTKCLEAPKVVVGDHVTFFLPAAQGVAGSSGAAPYTTCFEKSADHGYFIKKS